MSISFQEDGNFAAGTASISPTYPVTGLSAGDLFVAIVVHKYPAADQTTPSGWTRVGDHSAGSGASGGDSGEVRLCVYVKEAAGTESGSETFAVTGGNSTCGTIARFRKTGGTWNYQWSEGSDTALGSSWSAACSPDAYFEAGGIVVAALGVNGNLVLVTPSTPSASGVTFGTLTVRRIGNTSSGDDSGLGFATIPISAGDVSATPTFTATHPGASGNTPAGPVGFLVITENAPPGDTTAPTLTSATGTGGSLSCSGTVDTDEANGTLYAVFTASATAPSAAQVKAGQDHTGSAALRAVNQAVSATGTQSIGSGAITDGTRYAHYMHEDAAANQSTVVSSSSFVVTAGGGSPVGPLIGNKLVGGILVGGRLVR